MALPAYTAIGSEDEEGPISLDLVHAASSEPVVIGRLSAVVGKSGRKVLVVEDVSSNRRSI
mgnify:CR=1 FL=1